MDHPFCTYDLKIDICLSFKNNSIPIRFWMHSCLLKSLKYFLNYFELFLGKDHGLSRNQMYPSYVDVILLLHQLEVLSGLLDVYISGFASLLQLAGLRGQGVPILQGVVVDCQSVSLHSARARLCPSLQPLGDPVGPRVHGQAFGGASAHPRKLQAWGAKDGRQSSIRLSAAAVSREVPVGSTGNRLFAGYGLAGTGR